MKNQFMVICLFSLSCFAWNNGKAIPSTEPMDHNTEITCATSEETCNSMENPYFDVRICFTLFSVQACVTLRCDLHWSDAFIPGFGQLLGHDGCYPIGEAISTTTGNPTPELFEGSTENMLQAIEKVQKIPIGSLKNLAVTNGPTFPLPDGKIYRVVPKTYPIQRTPEGRTVALEVELVK